MSQKRVEIMKYTAILALIALMGAYSSAAVEEGMEGKNLNRLNVDVFVLRWHVNL